MAKSGRRQRQRKPAAPPPVAPEAPEKPRFWTWPRGILAAVVPLILAWAIPYFGPGLVEKIRTAGGGHLLSVTVLTDDQFSSEAHKDHSGQKIVDSPLSEIKPSWAKPAATPPDDAPDAASTLIRLVLRGKTSAQVTVQKIGLVVTRRDPPVRGLVVIGDQGGVAKPHYLKANLDTGEIAWNDEEGKPTGPLALTVSSSEEEIVDLLAFTEGYVPDPRGCDCRWHLSITYTVKGDGPKSMEVRPPGGGEFRTSSLARASTWNPGAATCEDPPKVAPLCDADASPPS
jgi:hypothetical protein